MEFVPSDTYIVMGHGKEPNVSLEEEHDFVPCACKIKAKDVSIGTRSNNGLMDLDPFFIVPANCIIVVRAKPGEVSHSSIINPLLNMIGAPANQELYKNPLADTKELINQLGPVSIFKPGDKFPNYQYTMLFQRAELESHSLSSHYGLLKTPLTRPMDVIAYDSKSRIIPVIDEIYGESVFPKKETVNNLILRNILKREPTPTETTTFRMLIKADRDDCGKFIDYLKQFFRVTQKQLLKIGDDGVAKRPGVYYNFVCRYVDADYYARQAYDNLDKVNPLIASILEQPRKTQELFYRVLTETLKHRTPYVRNLYAGGARRKIKKRKRTRKH